MKKLAANIFITSLDGRTNSGVTKGMALLFEEEGDLCVVVA
jgi:hypothetical protein